MKFLGNTLVVEQVDSMFHCFFNQLKDVKATLSNLTDLHATLNLILQDSANILICYVDRASGIQTPAKTNF